MVMHELCIAVTSTSASRLPPGALGSSTYQLSRACVSVCANRFPRPPSLSDTHRISTHLSRHAPYLTQGAALQGPCPPRTPILEDARRWSSASARSEVEPRTRTATRSLTTQLVGIASVCASDSFRDSVLFFFAPLAEP